MSSDSERTCVGCRQRAPKNQLLRVVANDLGSGLTVVPDPAGRMPGRGAHLHPTLECLALALRRRAFPRALRVTDRLASDVVEDYVQELAGTGARHRDGQQLTEMTDRNWSSSS